MFSEEIKCVVNKYELRDETQAFKVYNCSFCQGNPKNICEDCYENCHSHHIYSDKKDTEIFTYMNITKCSCALNNHNISYSQDYASNNTFRTETSARENKLCKLNSILSSVMECLFQEISEKKNYCLYCVHYCKKTPTADINKFYEVIPNLIDKENKFSYCSCINLRHLSSNENIQCLENLMSDKNLGKIINKRKLISTLINNKKYYEKYFQEIIKFHNTIIKTVTDSPLSIAALQKEKVPKQYEYSWSLLKTSSNLFENLKSNFSYTIETKEITQLFNFHFIKLIFSCEAVKQDHLICIKSQSLYLFRRFFLESVQSQNNLQQLGNFENISPIHRIIFRRGIRSFMADINEDMETFFLLLATIAKQIIEYFEKVEDDQHEQLVLEYLKIVLIIVNYYFDENEGIYFRQILMDMKSIMNIIYTKNTYKNSIQEILERIVYHALISKNDWLLRQLLMNKVESEEERRKRRNHHYSFENCATGKNLILSLFAFSKDKKSNYLLEPDIYDYLINRYDYYSESIKTLLESRSNSFISDNETYHLLLEDKEFIEKKVFLKDRTQEAPYYSILNTISNFNKLKKGFFDGNYNSFSFLEEIATNMQNIKQQLEILFSDFEDTLIMTVLLFKNGLYWYLINLWYFISKDIEKITNINEEEHIKKEEILQIICDILSMLFLKPKNIFCMSVLFTNYSLNYLLYNFHNEEILNFYSSCIKRLNKKFYKIDFSCLISYLTNSDLLREYIANEKYEKFFSLVGPIFKNCLRISNDKSIEKTNSTITSIIKKIISSSNFKETINNHFFNEEKHNQETGNFILLIFEIINHLSNYSFITITEFIDITALQKIIFTCDLDLASRKVFTQTLNRYFLESPFHIYKKMTLVKLQKYKECVDLNLIGKIELDENNGDDEPELLNFDTLFEIEEDTDYQEEDGIYQRNLQYSTFKLFGVTHLLFNLIKFKTILEMKQNEIYQESKKLNIKFFYRYFETIIFLPTVYALYKLTYFSPTFQILLKYLLFTIVHLFKKCLKHFLDLIHQDLKLRSTLNFYIHLGNNSEFDFFENLSQCADLVTFIEKIKKQLSDLLIEIELFKELDTEVILKKWAQVASHFKCFHDIKKINLTFNEKYKLDVSRNESLNKSSVTDNTLIQNLYDVYIGYIERKQQFRESALFNLFSSSGLREEEIKKTIALDIMFRIQAENNNLTFNDNNSLFIESLTRLFKVDPKLFQHLIIEFKLNLTFLAQNLLDFLQHIFIEFSRLNSTEFYAYDNFTNIVELFRLMCENHNVMFQTYLINYLIVEEEEIYLFEVLLNTSFIIYHNINHFISKESLILTFKSGLCVNCSYFDNLITSLADFYIEIVQGTLDINFDRIQTFYNFQEFLYLFNQISLKVSDCKLQFIYFISQFLRFFNALIEEKNNIHRNEMADIINNKSLLKVCMYTFKKIVFDTIREDRTDDFSLFEIELEDSKKLLKIFVEDNEFITSLYFIIPSQIFIYLKKVSQLNSASHQEPLKILTTLKELSQQNTNTFSNNKFSNIILKWKRELFIFFDNLIKDVEINFREEPKMTEKEFNSYRSFFYKEKGSKKVFKNIEKKSNFIFSEENRMTQNINTSLEKVTFLIHPKSLYLKESDSKKFVEDSYQHYSKMKLNYLLNYFENDLSTIINFREDMNHKKLRLLIYIDNLDHEFHNKITVGISFIINILQIMTLYYTSESNSNQQIMSNFTFIIFIISLFNNIYLFSLISSSLYYEIYKLKHVTVPVQNENLIQRFIYCVSLLTHKNVLIFTWSFIFGILGIIKFEFSFLYSLQLFAIFGVFPTMKVVIKSIIMRYEQFLSASLVIIISTLFYSSLSYYFFFDEFINSDTNDNLCGTYFQCFMNIFNSGLRSGAIGLPMHSVSNPNYWMEFALDWIFYLSLILIMLNVINGIIVDTFQELREEKVRNDDLKYNVCFICSIRRSQFEIKGVDFDFHTKFEHKINDYFYYIIKISKTDKYDLNSIDSHVLDCIEQRKTNFFPIKQAISLNEND